MADLTRTHHFINGEVADGDAVEDELNLYLANINARIHADGTEDMVGDLTIAKNNPAVILEGTESSGQNWRIREHVVATDSYLAIEAYDGVSAWVTLIDIPEDPTTLQTLIDDVLATQLQIEDDNPAVRFSGTEASGNDAKIEEDAGDLVFYISTDNGSTWDEVFRMSAAGDLEVANGLTVGTIDTADCIGFAQLNLIALCTDILISGNNDVDFDANAVYPLLSGAGLTVPSSAVPVIFVRIHTVTGTGTPVVTGLASIDDQEKVRIRYSVIDTGAAAWNFRLTVYALWTGV